MKLIKQILQLFGAIMAVLFTVIGTILFLGFAVEFIAYLLYNITVLKLAPLASLWDATWHTVMLVIIGGLLIFLGSFLANLVDD